METPKLSNTLVYLIGYPGTGKYTMAQELVRLGGFHLVDNHLINNPVFSLIRRDGVAKFPDRVWANVTRIWDAVIDTLVHISHPDDSFVLTNWLAEGDEGDRRHYEKVMNIAAQRNARFVPVRLLITDIGEHVQRITADNRKMRMKETDPAAPQRYAGMEVLHVDHPHALTLDVTALPATEAARLVLRHAESLT